ncbi:hypothetical protein AYL99_07658 [Fonsecaea erecta]|uniref:Transcription factor domain-containing protein n=1 Tax=Fonsecaea erecta TaxID=1367422 RepID=A0A178ZFN1_9EURO|nr:hypothetical protein AYL99_07658 [Fonsecaea erecta]OAP58568.1 hypothetical protein AYL99_07658 [Fonsecaea erecta]
MNACEASNFDYFRRVCARDFALYFESPWWEGVVLRYAHAEPSIFHAALSISVMSRTNYHPPSPASPLSSSSSTSWDHRYPGQPHPLHNADLDSAAEYCLAQYLLAIRQLNARLDSSVASVELAAFASILFVYIEGMHGSTRSMHIHLRGGLALVRTLDARMSPNVGHLGWALRQIREQVEQIEAREGT